MDRIGALLALPLPIYWELAGCMAYDMINDGECMELPEYEQCRKLIDIDKLAQTDQKTHRRTLMYRQTMPDSYDDYILYKMAEPDIKIDDFAKLYAKMSSNYIELLKSQCRGRIFFMPGEICDYFPLQLIDYRITSIRLTGFKYNIALKSLVIRRKIMSEEEAQCHPYTTLVRGAVRADEICKQLGIYNFCDGIFMLGVHLKHTYGVQ